MLIAIIIAALLLTQISFVSAHAASSTNVLLTNDLYSDMEFWAAEGLIESNLCSIKPLARSEVGKQLVASIDKCQAVETPSATCRHIQKYYEKIYETEINEAQTSANIRSSFLKPIENFSVSYK